VIVRLNCPSVPMVHWSGKQTHGAQRSGRAKRVSRLQIASLVLPSSVLALMDTSTTMHSYAQFTLSMQTFYGYDRSCWPLLGCCVTG
jgi:hypothetical protein